MFSGITKGLYEVTEVIQEPGLIIYKVKLDNTLMVNLDIGASVAIDGVCQSVVKIENQHVTFQAIQETLDKTTLSSLNVSRMVSVERSIHVGDEISGHEVSGHVHGTGQICEKIASNNNLTLGIRCDLAWMKYILPKGFIAVDGSSLTIGETDPPKGLFYIHLIPETLRVTNFSQKNINDLVNIELDYKTKIIVDTVENFLTHSLKEKVADFTN